MFYLRITERDGMKRESSHSKKEGGRQGKANKKTKCQVGRNQAYELRQNTAITA